MSKHRPSPRFPLPLPLGHRSADPSPILTYSDPRGRRQRSLAPLVYLPWKGYGRGRGLSQLELLVEGEEGTQEPRGSGEGGTLGLQPTT